MNLFKLLFPSFLLFQFNFLLTLGNSDSSDSDINDDSKPVKEAYQNAYYEVKSGNFQLPSNI